NPSLQTLSENAAYIIYTSGSTGKPKGVVIRHISTVGLCRWAEHTYSPKELSEVLASTSICFDLSIFELFVPLVCGQRVRIVPNIMKLSEAAFESVTLINTVPSVLMELLKWGTELPKSIQVVNLDGEVEPSVLLKRL